MTYPDPICGAGRYLSRDDDPDWAAPCNLPTSSYLIVPDLEGGPAQIPLCEKHVQLLDEWMEKMGGYINPDDN